jgi:hypothetical protein
MLTCYEYTITVRRHGTVQYINGNWAQTGSDIFRVQTPRVSQTIVFRYREIGGLLCMK